MSKGASYICIISDKIKTEVLKGNITREQLDNIYLQDVKILYEFYVNIQDKLFSSEEADAIFLKDLRFIYQVFEALRAQLQPRRLEWARSGYERDTGDYDWGPHSGRAA